MEKLTPPQENLDPTAVDVAESAFEAAGDRLTETVRGSNQQVALQGGESVRQGEARQDLSMDVDYEETELYRQRTLERREKRREKFAIAARAVGRLLIRH